MVSFQCESCGDVFTKKKLDAHTNRCWNTSFTCLDCHSQFWNGSYKSHTSCISEDQKYQGALYKEKKPKFQDRKAPRVEDIGTPPSTIKQPKVHFEDVPPPAPSPPSAAAAVNVFDYMEPDSDVESSASSLSSSVSAGGGSNRSPSPEQGRGLSKRASTNASATLSQQQYAHPQHQDQHGYAQPQHPPPYGYSSQQQHPPPAYWYPQPPSQGQPPPPGSLRTPAPQHHQAPELSRSDSQKKRKRSPTNDTTSSTQQNSTLHSGLTGGLNRMLNAPEVEPGRSTEASPLSPKKRHKRSAEEPSTTYKTKEVEKPAKKRQRETSHATSASMSTALVSTKSKRERDHSSQRSSQAPTGRRLLTHPTTTQEKHQARSEFFLSLIDKDHRSVKGQSIWGALKSFHEGRREGAGRDEVARLEEEKRLLRGLRCRINRQGEVVLFARPEAE